MAIVQKSHTELNPLQVSLLRLFNRPMSEKETLELKKLLTDYYADKLEVEVNRVVSEKGYTQEDFDKMLNADS
ncbi:hypothetical protein MTO98_25245 [Mucilaginibacter sp. SMC90]|uniref:hypothetical protein n=1 Tax=Mucilaginibacter sp. SMC90 TaxID=2929803 RepID=UPI001FB3F147|nr:hypothetical protein [Mucilaginibacter sp. SMC90]UOE47721.1 hypothetical protein MTO98_25245 [Mucilaginibacter sp. SMC90]